MIQYELRKYFEQNLPRKFHKFICHDLAEYYYVYQRS